MSTFVPGIATFVLLLGLYALYSSFKPVRPNLLSWEIPNEERSDMILKFSNGTQYIGSCTVWYTYPEFRRCGTLTESWLSEVYTKIKFEEQTNAG